MRIYTISNLSIAMDTINWSVEETNKLELFQNKVGRMGLGANKIVGVESIRGDMGWSSFKERLFKGKLKCKIRLEKMDDDRWAKKCYQEVGTKSRWNMNCARIVNKCGLSKRWIFEGQISTGGNGN